MEWNERECVDSLLAEVPLKDRKSEREGGLRDYYCSSSFREPTYLSGLPGILKQRVIYGM